MLHKMLIHKVFVVGYISCSHLLLQGDHIKGLKLRRIDAYCEGAVVHQGQKESLVYCSLSTAAALPSSVPLSLSLRVPQ